MDREVRTQTVLSMAMALQAGYMLTSSFLHGGNRDDLEITVSIAC